MAVRNPRTRRVFERSLSPSRRTTRALVEGLRARAEHRGGVEAREWDELAARMEMLALGAYGPNARKVLTDAWTSPPLGRFIVTCDAGHEYGDAYVKRADAERFAARLRGRYDGAGFAVSEIV